MIELEKRGTPTASWTAQHFQRDAQRSAQTFGLYGLPLALVALPFTNQVPDRIHEMVDGAVDQAIAGLTEPVQPGDGAVPKARASEVLTFDGEDLLDTVEAMTEEFLREGWSDGFPLVPPTPALLDRMLRGTSLPPDKVVAVLEPGFGLATVEKIATNAILAGCRPEHMPVLIAAVEAMADPQIYLRNKAMSTGPHAPIIIVNGPIAREININAKTCALGPGAQSYANTVIGRAVRLIMMNIGHTYAGVSDMDTIGSPAKYSMCIAENEEDSPWEPYHTDKGYDKDESTVTIMFVYGICELHDFTSTAPNGLIRVFATAATNVAQVGTGMWLIGRRADPRFKVEEQEHNLMLVCPEHADIFAEAGWSKQQIKEAMFQKSQMSFETLMLNKEPKGLKMAHPELQNLWDSPDTMLPVVEDPDCFDVVVLGGAAGRGAYLYGAGSPVTKGIQK